MNGWVTWVLALVLFGYNILDVHQTKMLLSVGAVEMNPLMSFMINSFGVNSLFVTKITLFMGLFILLFIHQKQ